MRLIASLLLVLCAAFAAIAQDYPTRPVRIIVPYAPGGVTDIAARLIGNKLGEAWKQSVVVENRPGGGGVVGTLAGVKATPDGYTLLAATISEFAITPPLYKKFPFDPINMLRPA